MYYYRHQGLLILSALPRPGLGFEALPAAPAEADSAVFLFEADPRACRASFSPSHPGQLICPESPLFLDASRLPAGPDEPLVNRLIARSGLRAVNIGHPGWRELLAPASAPGKKRVNILAMGDVGSTLLTGLTLLGGDVISHIGVCDLSHEITARWAFEMNHVSLPWDYGAFPPVDPVPPEGLFDCDLFVFVASKGIPPVGSAVRDVRMAQFQQNSAIVARYAKMARQQKFQGLWAAVSDPVDPLAKTAFWESNVNQDGVFDGRGLRPEQVQGYGLGVMNARAAYFAKRDPRFASFLTEGRSFGPHGEGLVIANSVEGYDDGISQELTRLTVTANLRMRELGFKPYVAPALSSGALSLLLTLRGQWHCGSVFLGGAYMGCKNRFTPAGVETECLPHIPDALFERIQSAAGHLAAII